jgi:hypothetical protein
MSRRAWLSALLLLLLGFGLFFARRPTATTPERVSAAAGPIAAPSPSSAEADGTAPVRDAATRRDGADPAGTRARSEAQLRARARSDAMRERIRERLATRPSGGDGRAPGGGASDEPEPADGTGGLTNRMGPRSEALAAAVNRELLPLAQECIDAAIEREPALRGTLAIEIDAVGDGEVGAVVDRVEFPADNGVQQAELLECMRESSLSIALPPPPAGGRVELAITMGVGEPAPDPPR